MGLDFEKSGNVATEASNPNEGVDGTRQTSRYTSVGQSIVDLQSALHKSSVSIVASAPADPTFPPIEFACAPADASATFSFSEHKFVDRFRMQNDFSPSSRSLIAHASQRQTYFSPSNSSSQLKQRRKRQMQRRRQWLLF